MKSNRRGMTTVEVIVLVILVAIGLLAIVTVYGNHLKDLAHGQSAELRGTDSDLYSMSENADNHDTTGTTQPDLPPDSGVSSVSASSKTAAPIASGTAPALAGLLRIPDTTGRLSGKLSGLGGTLYDRHAALAESDWQLELSDAQAAETRPFLAGWRANRGRYESVAKATGLPAKLVAAIHWRESGGRFDQTLSEGELGGETWEASAARSLGRSEGLRRELGLTADSRDEAAMAAYAEAYSGLAHHHRGESSPNLYAGTSAVGSPGVARLAGSSASAGGPALGVMALVRLSDSRDVLAMLDAHNAHLDDADRGAKYERMRTDPFAFYRGSNHLFWSDLARDERLKRFGGTEKSKTWVGGDMHPGNMGAFANDKGEVVFDLNDFDEAVVADYQLDVWRAATGVALVARQYADLSAEEERELLDAFTESYLDTLAGYEKNKDERDRVFDADSTYGRLDDFLEEVEAKESREKMLGKWTTRDGGKPVFDVAGNPKLGSVAPDRAAALRAAIGGAYKDSLGGRFGDDHLEVKDVARRLDAGVGSLGSARYYVLIEGPTDSPDDDIILDVKAQGEPSGWRYLDESSREASAASGDHAARTVTAAKALGVRVDDHMGHLELDRETFSVRERSPWKESFPLEELDSKKRLTKMAEQWGAVLATAHARADDDSGSSGLDHSFEKEVGRRVDGKHAEFRELVREVALDYADQVADDHALFESRLD